MNQTARLQERIDKAFDPNARGVVGVVDELLLLCRERPLKLAWVDGACHIRQLGTAAGNGDRTFWSFLRRYFVKDTSSHHEGVFLRLPKSVFRAILARLAALCNERRPDSVSPYGGGGEVVIEGDTPAVFAVTFTNTPDEQRAEVRFVGERTEKPGGAPDPA